MRIDPMGTFFLLALLIGIGVGIAIGATVAGVKGYKDGYRGWDLVGQIALGGLIGGLGGAAIGAGIGLIGIGIGAIGGSLALIGGGMLIGGSAVVVGAASVVVGVGVLITTVVNIISLFKYLFSEKANRFGKSKIGSNSHFNKQFDDFWNQYGDGNLDTRRSFHDYISKKGYNTWKQLLKAWENFLKMRVI